MNRLMLVVSLAVLLTLGSCSKAVEGDGEAPIKAIKISSAVAAKVNDFSFRLFKQVQDQEPAGENIFISHLSLHMDLGMVLNGATGETRQEIFNALGMETGDLAAANQAYQSLLKGLPTADPKVELGLYNSLWYRNTWNLKEAYTSELQKSFEATVTPLDFKPSDKDDINQWAYDKTHGKIPKVIDQISSEDVLFLLNALYFKGKWSSQFKKVATKPADFYLEDNRVKTVQMMHQQHAFEIYHSADFDAMRLPYGNGQFAMTVILPKEGKKLQELMGQISGDTWQTIKDQSLESNVDLGLPRFSVPSFEVNLLPVMQKMGMQKAFTEMAEFSDMADSNQGHLFVTGIKQNTFLKVDEEGTEAAAVTTIGVGTTSAPQLERFICDHPFGIIISEKSSDAILFMGTIMNPQSE